MATGPVFLAAHYYADQVGTGTDFGLYFVRYSSRLPFLGFTNGGLTMSQSCAQLTVASGGALDCTSTTGVGAAFAHSANQSTYFLDFPTVNTLGASFSTTVGGTALSGEVTYSPKMLFGISDFELNASQIDGLGATPYLSGGLATTFSSYLAGGATFVFNAGFVYVPDAGKYPLNRAGPEAALKNSIAAAAVFHVASNPQYATSFSSGYQALLKVNYNNAFGTPITLSPSIGFRHDVLGYLSGPITTNYLKGLKQVSLGVPGTYQQIKVSLS